MHSDGTTVKSEPVHDMNPDGIPTDSDALAGVSPGGKDELEASSGREIAELYSNYLKEKNALRNSLPSNLDASLPLLEARKEAVLKLYQHLAKKPNDGEH